MAKKIERRTYSVRDVEARNDDSGMRLAGYAAVFNDASLPLPFKESIAPGAFRKTLDETPDVRMLINHEGLPVARTKNKTLKLYEDERGLRFEADLADTQEGRDIYELVKRGDVDQMSFAFRVIRQKWNDDRSRRVLTEVSLSDGDISVVTYPAYPTTTVEAREHLKEAIKAYQEGREVTGESLAVLKTIFSDLEEGHEYIMRAVEMMAMMVNGEEVEEEARESVGDFVEWDSSGGTARGRIESIKEEGVLDIPDTEFTITAEEGDPAVLIRVYEEFRDGWRATETLVGHKMSELRYIDPLPEATEEEGRKISLRLAQAMVSNISVKKNRNNPNRDELGRFAEGSNKKEGSDGTVSSDEVKPISGNMNPYEGFHNAPTRENGAPLSDLTGNGIYPADVYSKKGQYLYGTGHRDGLDAEAHKLIVSLQGKPNAVVKVYRSIPKNVEGGINPGDWVTPFKQYAIDHGIGNLNNDFKIVSLDAKASDLFTEGNSWLEWGYDPAPNS